MVLATVDRRARRGRRKVGGRADVCRGVWKMERPRLLLRVAAMVSESTELNNSAFTYREI